MQTKKSTCTSCLVGGDVKICYIDSNEAAASVFGQVASQMNLECATITDGKRVVMRLMEIAFAPTAIFICCNFKHIPCKSLIEFIRKQSHLNSASIILIADYLTNKELRAFGMQGVDKFVLSRLDIPTIRATLSGLMAGEF